jgi:hypothetical protein
MSKEKLPSKTTPRSKSRRHGYRGYGSPLHKTPGGTIHYPSGFTGVEIPATGRILPERPELPSEEWVEDEAREKGSKK